MSTEPFLDPFKIERQRKEPPQQSATSVLRQQRVDEYERDGLKNPEASSAFLAAIQAEQIRIAFALGDAVKKMLTSSVSKPEQIGELVPSINVYLRVTRQIERFGQLEIRQAELQQNADPLQVNSSDQDSQHGATDKASRKPPK